MASSIEFERIIQGRPPLEGAFKALLKELIWRFLRRREGGRPICLYASRRSGSTLVMQVLHANRGVTFSDQPFGLYTASSANINRLPIFAYGQIAEPDQEEWDSIREYLEGLFSGRLVANGPWKFWGSSFDWVSDRIVLKITDAKSLADRIGGHFDVNTLVITRHPIPQSLSVMRNGWRVTGKGLLRNSRFAARWLNPEQVARSESVYDGASPLQQHVLDWILENLPLLTLLPQRPDWAYLAYEEMLIDPEASVGYLAGALDLHDLRAMERQLARPSRSTKSSSTPETKEQIRAGDFSALVGGWKASVDEKDLAGVQELLDLFEVGLYSAAEAFPHPEVLGRASPPGDRS